MVAGRARAIGRGDKRLSEAEGAENEPALGDSLEALKGDGQPAHAHAEHVAQGPELLDAAPRQVDGEALNRVDESRLHERHALAQQNIMRFLPRKSPGDEIIEVDDVVEEARDLEAAAESLEVAADATKYEPKRLDGVKKLYATRADDPARVARCSYTHVAPAGADIDRRVRRARSIRTSTESARLWTTRQL